MNNESKVAKMIDKEVSQVTSYVILGTRTWDSKSKEQNCPCSC